LGQRQLLHARLVDLKPIHPFTDEATRVQLLGILFPEFVKAPVPACVPTTSVSALEPALPAPLGALAEATLIAQSAAVAGEIDWACEPLTEREGAVRLRIIEKHKANIDIGWFNRINLAIAMRNLSNVMRRRSSKDHVRPKELEPASDMAAGLRWADEQRAQIIADLKRTEIEEAIRDLDGAA
jgi:hypothetical protein